MRHMADMANKQITESLNYDSVIALLEEAKNNDTPLEEGLFSALFGGAAAVAVGPAVMKCVCKVLGVDEKGAFGQLLTSKLVLGALAATIGWKQ